MSSKLIGKTPTSLDPKLVAFKVFKYAIITPDEFLKPAIPREHESPNRQVVGIFSAPGQDGKHQYAGPVVYATISSQSGVQLLDNALSALVKAAKLLDRGYFRSQFSPGI